MKSALLDSIGNTPLLRLKNLEEYLGLGFELYAKLERSNPTGSVKDRAAKWMIVKAMERGDVKEGTLVIEPTSGNTGISLAAICASLNLPLEIYMPENASRERVLMMEAYGAKVILTPKQEGMNGAVKRAKDRQDQVKGSYMPLQFENEDNVLAHYESTGPEIYKEIGAPDCFIASFGTGGTLMGTSKYLREKNPSLYVVGAEPASSPLVTKGSTGPHLIQGIGANFLPSIMDPSKVDLVVDVENEEAYEGTRLLSSKEGLLCGISSGANIMAAFKIKERLKGMKVVTILPDNGERYLSLEGLWK